MTWIDAMVADGAHVWATGSRIAVRDLHGRAHGPVPLVRWYRYVRPADLGRLPDGVMLVADRITDSAAALLSERGCWWATTDGRYRAAGMSGAAGAAPDPMATRRPAPLATQLGVLLLAAPGRPHRFYAAALGVSRARVSQLLGSSQASRRCPEALLDAWRVAGAATAGHVSRWASAGSAWPKTADAYAWLESQGCDPVVGGEIAADAVLPWRAPGSAVLHVRKLTPPPPGFVVADSHHRAMVTVVIDPNAALAAVARPLDTPLGRMRVAHPLHIAQDLVDAATDDERAEQQRALLLSSVGTGRR